MRLENKKMLFTGADEFIGSHPINPMPKRNVILTGVMEVFPMLILAFLIE